MVLKIKTIYVVNIVVYIYFSRGASKYKGPINQVNLDDYKLDIRLIGKPVFKFTQFDLQNHFQGRHKK